MTSLSARIIGVIEFVKRRARFLGRLVPAALRRSLSDQLYERAQLSFPDRVFLERQIVPVLASGRFQRVLSVGVERYTAHQPALFDTAGVEFWTVDILAANAGFGAPRRHLVADVCTLDEHFGPSFFDAVLFNGVIGFGVDDAETADRAVAALAHVLTPDGWLVLGWNVDKGVAALELPALRRCFSPLTAPDLPQETTFRGSTHRFDLFSRNAA